MSNLTFQELSDGANDCVVVTGGNVFIDVSLLIGEAVADLESDRVFEALGKLLKFSYEVQEVKNVSLPDGQKLAAVQEPSTNVPALQSGRIVATTEYALRLIHELDVNDPVAPVA